MIVFDNSINRMTERELAAFLISDFIRSPERRDMIDGQAYYRTDNPEIMHRRRFRFKEDPGTGNIIRVVDKAKPNNRRAHGFMHMFVEDKVNYLLSKPYTLSCEKSQEFLDKVNLILSKTFQQKRMIKLGKTASNGGIAWLHPYIDEDGSFRTMIIPPEQCIPGWKDNDHDEMTEFIWFYDVEIIEGHTVKDVLKVEYWTADGVAYYVSDMTYQDGMNPNSGAISLILDSERYLNEPDRDGDFTGHFIMDGAAEAWGRIPFIPFKNNDDELPDLHFIKTLIDGYDKNRSDTANYLEEVENFIMKLKGYGGNDLGAFMRDLSYFRAINLDVDGDADVLTATVDISAQDTDAEKLKKDIMLFGEGVDKASDQLGNSPSGIALKFMYSGLDLKCNRMEAAFKDGFDKLIWFVNRYLEITCGGPDYDANIDITFNRDININESQAITDCQNSQGVISQETILKNHPWVEDVDIELRRLNQEKEAAQSMVSDMFINEPTDGEGNDAD